MNVQQKHYKAKKATGPNNTSYELQQYDYCTTSSTQTWLKSFEESKFLDAVGECLEITRSFAKPGKSPGEEKSRKPLTFCNDAR